MDQYLRPPSPLWIYMVIWKKNPSPWSSTWWFMDVPKGIFKIGVLDIFRNFCLKLYLPITKNSVCKCILINVPTWPQNDCFHPTTYRIHANKPPAVYKNFILSRWWSSEFFSNFCPKILYWWWLDIPIVWCGIDMTPHHKSVV